jgi:hypothetical protein
MLLRRHVLRPRARKRRGVFRRVVDCGHTPVRLLAALPVSALRGEEERLMPRPVARLAAVEHRTVAAWRLVAEARVVAGASKIA